MKERGRDKENQLYLTIQLILLPCVFLSLHEITNYLSPRCVLSNVNRESKSSKRQEYLCSHTHNSHYMPCDMWSMKPINTYTYYCKAQVLLCSLLNEWTNCWEEEGSGSHMKLMEFLTDSAGLLVLHKELQLFLTVSIYFLFIYWKIIRAYYTLTSIRIYLFMQNYLLENSKKRRYYLQIILLISNL